MPEHEHGRGTGRRQGHIRIVVRTRDPPIRTRVNVRAVRPQHTREPRLYQGLSPALRRPRFSLGDREARYTACRIHVRIWLAIFKREKSKNDIRCDIQTLFPSLSDCIYGYYTSHK